MPLATCGTFLLSKFVCTSLLILHPRIKSLKKSGVVAVKSVSIELKSSYTRVGGTYKKTPTIKYSFR